MARKRREKQWQQAAGSGTPAVPGAGRRPWEQWDGETPQAYAAFLAYRDMGRADRSIRKLAEAYHQRTGRKARTAAARFLRWSRKWSWVFRADQWDAWLDQTAEELLRERLGKLAEEWATIVRASRAAIAKALQDVLQKLDDPANAPSFGSIYTAMEIAYKLEHTLAAESQERLAQAGGAGLAGAVDPFDELMRRLDLMAERRRQVEQTIGRAGMEIPDQQPPAPPGGPQASG
ncbi:MAG: hypothetical protein QN174_07705 [Armatimonadota bacterium]|nr:hypothetical protein [Armatimonadota bacterium]